MQEFSGKLTVSRLVALLQDVVETNFVSVTVEGEISNFSTPPSGHWYFTLKDSTAQMRCVMFRGRNRLIENPPDNGMQIISSGAVTIYPARGELQMIVESFAVSGRGSLQASYEALKRKLSSEGLFAPERKRKLPLFPRSVGIVTSERGAAIHDIFTVMQRRAPNVYLVLRPVKVQGSGAAEEIAEAINDLNCHQELDVLIVGRGGGSVEDLWAFNEEVVARAISASAIPVISAVGHETDFTISDLIADLRAPTPSAAAELVAKNHQELETHLDHLFIRLISRIDQTVGFFVERLSGLESRLKVNRRDFLGLNDKLKELDIRLANVIRSQMLRYTDNLAIAAGRLDALSPLHQLDRGYVLASRRQDGTELINFDTLAQGDLVWLRFARGMASAQIKEVIKK